MGAAIRAFDWTATSLGQPAAWPPTLKATVRIMLTTRHPMFIFWGEESICLYNDAYRASLGPEKHPAMLGQPARSHWSEIWDTIGPQISLVMRGQGSTWHENQLIPIIRNGRLEDVYWTYSYGPIDDETAPDGVGGVLVVCTETTEQVLAEHRASEERGRFVALFDQAPSFMAMLRGPEHLIELANPAYFKLVGHRPVIGRTVAEALPDAVEQGFLTLLDSVYQSGEAFVARSARLALQHRPGGPIDERFVDFVYQPIKDAGGLVTGIFVEGVDVTEREAADTALRTSEARYRTMAEALPQLVWTCRPDGQCDYLSRQWVEYTGMTASEQLGFDWLEQVIHPDDRERTLAHWMGAVRGEHPYDIEYRIRRHDGQFSWFKTRGTPIRDADGNIAYWFGTCTDIEDIIQAREVLTRSSAELDRLVRERTVALEAAQEALRQSQKLEAMGQLTGGVAHDFNNLLTPILGGLDMLQRAGIGGERERRIIAAALTSSERAKTLIQRLLAFARRQPLQLQAVNLIELVAGMADLIKSTSGPRINVELSLPDTLPLARVDANQLEMALLNLSVNARDAMPDGGRLTISLEQRDVGLVGERQLDAEQVVVMRISDTGRGMDEATLARAIEPFFSTKGIGQGTGLGLSMVHGLVSQLGGDLKIQSKVGFGTSVELWLPATGAGVAGEARRPSSITLGNPSTGSVLLVDDEELVRTNTADMLKSLGYNVVEAHDAAQALELIENGAVFDILVTDHLMPGITGEQLAEVVTQRFPDTRVLIVSGYAENEGMRTDYARLTKPFRQDDLVASLFQA